MDTPIFETWLRPWLRMALLGRPAPDDSRSHHVLLMYYFFSVIATSQAVWPAPAKRISGVGT